VPNLVASAYIGVPPPKKKKRISGTVLRLDVKPVWPPTNTPVPHTGVTMPIWVGTSVKWAGP